MDCNKLSCKRCGGQHNYENCPVAKKERKEKLERARRKVTALVFEGDTDALTAGFTVHLECGHSFWRPTNILACDGVGQHLREKGAICKDCLLKLS